VKACEIHCCKTCTALNVGVSTELEAESSSVEVIVLNGIIEKVWPRSSLDPLISKRVPLHVFAKLEHSVSMRWKSFLGIVHFVSKELRVFN
jgi:hypothetical protein